MTHHRNFFRFFQIFPIFAGHPPPFFSDVLIFSFLIWRPTPISPHFFGKKKYDSYKKVCNVNFLSMQLYAALMAPLHIEKMLILVDIEKNYSHFINFHNKYRKYGHGIF